MSTGRRDRAGKVCPVAEREVAAELAHHLEEETRRLIESGLSASEARAEVLRRTGPIASAHDTCVRITRQRLRREAVRSWIASLNGDIRLGVRTLWKHPRFSALCILTIALGLGPATTLFSIANDVLWSPLPYPDSNRIVRIGSVFPGGGMGPIPGPMFRDWQQSSDSHEDFAAIMVEELDLPAEGGEPTRIRTGVVSVNFARLFGLEVPTGRWFSPDEDRVLRDRVVILSHGIWESRWGSDPSVLGRTVLLDGDAHTIIGIAAQGFLPPETLGLEDIAAWVPLVQSHQALEIHDNWFLRVAARVPEGTVPEDATERLRTQTANLITSYPVDAYEDGFEVQAASLRDDTVGDAQGRLGLLLGAAGLLLLTACVNVAHLNLVRGRERLGEMAIRGYLGANRRRLTLQLLVESVVLGSVGALMAGGLAFGGVAAFRALAPGDIPRLAEVSVDLTGFMFALLAVLTTALMFGLVPSFATIRSASAGRGSPRSGVDRSSSGGWLRELLIGAEIAVTLVLMIGAGLLGRSLLRTLQVDPGFDPDRVTVVHLSLPSHVTDREERANAFEAIRSSLHSIPDVESVGMVNGLPFGGTGSGGSLVVDHPSFGSEGFTPVRWSFVEPSYFEALSVETLPGGRFPTESEMATGAPVVLVNEAFVRNYLEGDPAIGQRLQVLQTGEGAPWRTIVGVVPDMKPGRLDRNAAPEVYVPYRSGHVLFPTMEFVVRGRSDWVSAEALRAAIWTVAPDQPVRWVATLDDRIRGSVARPRYLAMLIGFFAATALSLALVGIYGAVAYGIAQRKRELAIRRAVGATDSAIRRLVVLGTSRALIVGLVAGAICAGLGSRVLEGLLYGVDPVDLGSYLGAAATLAVAALAASLLPTMKHSGDDLLRR